MIHGDELEFIPKSALKIISAQTVAKEILDFLFKLSISGPLYEDCRL